MKKKGQPAGHILERLERRDTRTADTLSHIYPGSDDSALERQIERYRRALKCFTASYGAERKAVVFRAPGRLNLLEYLDMARGPHLSAALDRDLIMVASSSGKDSLEVAHCEDREFPPRRLHASEDLRRLKDKARGMTWADAVHAHPHAGREQGDYVNYLLAPLLRLMWSGVLSSPRGMQWALGPATLPMRAGLSSSSALVVLSYMAAQWCNPHWPVRDTHETALMLGEAEWYVGTRGGANDHMTILLNPPGGVVINHHEISPPTAEPLPFPDGVEILLINTLWDADKAMGAMGAFNARKIELDLAATFIRNRNPELPKRFRHLGSLDPDLLRLTPGEVEQIVESLPDHLTVDEAEDALGMDTAETLRRFPGIPGSPFKLKSRARFFQKELELGTRIKSILLRSGELNVGLPEYDKLLLEFGEAINGVQKLLREDMEVSCEGIDDLIDLLAGIPGVLGAKLTGAGFGGCVAAFCRKEQVEHVALEVKKQYYISRRFEAYRRHIAGIPDPTARRGLIERLEGTLAHPERAVMRVRCAGGAGRVDL